MPGAEIELNYAAIGEFLRTSPELREHLTELGRRGVDYARSIAPVGHRATKATEPGQYRDSIGFEIVEGRTRMSLLIYASDYTAWWLEYGSRHNAKYAVLRRTLDYLRSGTPRAATEYGGAEAYDAAHAGTQRKRELRRRYRVLRAARP